MIEQIEAGNLPEESVWVDYINSLRSKVVPADINILDEAFCDAVRKRIAKEKVGVLFSGGVDSTLIAFLLKKFKANVTCFSVGLKGSPDLSVAKRAADILKLKLVFKEFSEDEALDVFRQTAAVYKDPSTLDIGVGGVVFAGISLGLKHGIKVFFTGLGSEEIFAGYQRHELSDNIQEECWKGLISMYKRDFLRDVPVAKHFNIKLKLPFLDEKVILAAMGIPADEKIINNLKKMPIRRVALRHGLPEEFALRKKKAAQYGSGFDKLLVRLAKKSKLSKADFIKRFRD